MAYLASKGSLKINYMNSKREPEIHFHSDPWMTKRILSSKAFKLRGDPYSPFGRPTTEQIIRGALQDSSNRERWAFFTHAWVVTAQTSGWIFTIGLLLMIGNITFEPWDFRMGMLSMCSIPFIVSGSLIGISFQFYNKKGKCLNLPYRFFDENDKSLKYIIVDPVFFIRQELLRPAIIGGIYGLGITIFLYAVASYASTNSLGSL